MDGVQQGQAVLESIGHRDRDGAIERDHGRRVDVREHAVEGCYLRPIGLARRPGLGMQRRDRRLDGIGSQRATTQGLLDQRRPLRDLRAIPARAVLLCEQHEGALGISTGGTAGIVE